MPNRAIFLLALLMTNARFARGSQVDSLDIYSPSMHKAIKCMVILPQDYTFLGQPYPVLYLLHGWSGNFAAWLHDAPQLREQADSRRMIIVCPDGGYDSWYLDSPVDAAVRYETHVTREVVPFIDYYYFTKKDRNARAIAGLSMGGHGALYLAIRNPEIFGAAGSMAGGLDLRPFKKNAWDLEGVLGDPALFWNNWEQNSVVNLISRLKDAKINLIIDCGVDDFFLEANREMHRRLLAEKIPHEYTERPGGHSHDYWANAVDMQVEFFQKFFQQNR